MDLIPLDYRKKQLLHRSLRRFMVGCLALLCGIGLLRLTLSYLTGRENSLVARLERQEQDQQQNKARAAEYVRQTRELEQQLAALDELHGHERMSVFLRAIDAAHSANIWFNEVRFSTRKDDDHAAATPPEAAQARVSRATATAPAEARQAVEIVGHALNYASLADYLNRLAAQPGIAELRLMTTNLRNYTAIRVVDFTLGLQLNKKPVEVH